MSFQSIEYMRYIRQSTMDEGLWNHVDFYNKYQLPTRLDDTVVIDVGCHIGQFANACLRRGSKFVYGYEPHPENIELAVKNLGEYREKICLQPKAVWRSDVAVESLKHTGFDYNTGSGVVYDPDGFLPVEVISLQDAIALALKTYPQVDILKISCNGSEYPTLLTTSLDGVINVIGEYKIFKEVPPLLQELGELTPESLWDYFKGQGFNFEYEQLDDGCNLDTARFIAVRNM
jgi:FkbM family methyltransferase